MCREIDATKNIFLQFEYSIMFMLFVTTCGATLDCRVGLRRCCPLRRWLGAWCLDGLSCGWWFRAASVWGLFFLILVLYHCCLYYISTAHHPFRPPPDDGHLLYLYLNYIHSVEFFWEIFEESFLHCLLRGSCFVLDW